MSDEKTCMDAEQLEVPSAATPVRSHLDLAVQALKDILHPIAKVRREMPDGHQIDGMMLNRYVESPSCYQDIARQALREIGESI